MTLEKLPEESYLDWKYRLIEDKLLGVSDADWQDIVEKLDLKLHRDTLRKGAIFFLEMKNYFESKMNGDMSGEQLDSLTIKKLELQKERAKLASEKNELNRWLREQARTENIYEKLEAAISQLPVITPPSVQVKSETGNRKTAVIDLADSHFGRSGKIKGLKGETIAEYSVEIFKRRMWDLLDYIVDITDKEEISRVTVLNLSDSIDGLLRFKQLQFLELGVLDQTMQYAEFLAIWLNALSNHVSIEYRSVLGNHTETRPLGSQRGDFEQENMERIIVWYIKSRLKSNSRITIHDPESIIYFDVLGTKILATHGQDERNLEQSLKDYMMMYQVPVHLMKTGHLHHLNNKTIGMAGIQNIEVVQSPSICGIDEYSMKLKKTSNAGSLITIFKENYGKLCTYDIRLK